MNPTGPIDTDPPASDYPITVTNVLTQEVLASAGNTLVVDDEGSGLDGFRMILPPWALPADTEVTIGTVNNPPALPPNWNYVGPPVAFGPHGTAMNLAVTLQIPYSDNALSDAGISDDTALSLYTYDADGDVWVEVPIRGIDTFNNVLVADINHFSHYAVTGLGGTPPVDLGTPLPGDLLYRSSHGGWRPGHVGVYTGERAYPGIGQASPEVLEYGRYNVIEALDGGVQYSYYDIPNVTEAHESQLDCFAQDDVFMGSREAKGDTLTGEQRQAVISYVESQIGKPYATGPLVLAHYGMLAGSAAKGPDSFNCVGLAEKAYEVAGVNDGQGLTSSWQEEVGSGVPGKLLDIPPVLTPAEHYNQTRPAAGVDPRPTIEWARITPDHGTPETVVLIQLAVSHTYGLDYIAGVIYVTEHGYTNPNYYINDEGLQGDIEAGDGIYSVSGIAGGDPDWGQVRATFTVADMFGNAQSVELIYSYDKLLDKGTQREPERGLCGGLFR
jgi:hypothetical protein